MIQNPNQSKNTKTDIGTTQTDINTSIDVSLPPLGPNDTFIVPNLQVPKNLKKGKSLFSLQTIKYYE